MRPLICSSTALLLSIALLPGARFGLEHTSKIVRVAEPQIAPDGKSIVVLVSRANLEDNRYDGELVLVDVASRNQRVLTHNRTGVAHPRWSPTGDRLAFLASVEGKPQVFVMPMNGGDAWQVTRAAEGVSGFAWKPDGAVLAFVTQDVRPSRTGEERHNRSFEAQHNDMFATTPPLASHLWVVPAGGGTARRLTSASGSIWRGPDNPIGTPLSWSRDGRSMALLKVKTPYSGDLAQIEVEIVDAETGATKALTGGAKPALEPELSPDGRHVAYLSPRQGTFFESVFELWVSPATGGERRSVTRTLDRNLQRALWMPDSKSLLVIANDRTTTGLWIQPVDGPARRIDNASVVVSNRMFALHTSVSPTGQIAFIGGEPDRPAELYYLNSVSARPERLTDFNGTIAALELGRMETIEWDGPDGLRQDGVVTYPPGYVAGQKYPLALHIHGGPTSASKQVFGPRPQLFAAQGWIVFEPNYRGSDNRGNAFQVAILQDAGAGPGRDVMSGVEQLIRRGLVDESRMAVSGWSYGGYMTTWLLGHYPDKWKAGVAGAAVTDLLDSYSLSDVNAGVWTQFIGGSPWTDAARLKAAVEQSPITYAPQIKAPTLILSNTGDARVPITQSYKLYHALRDNGVKVKFIAYPLPGHSPADPIHERDVLRRWLEWLKEHLDQPKAAGVRP